MNESIGDLLKQKREERNLTLEQVSAETHIRLHYLTALEEDQLDRLPSRFQARGFVRAYAALLGLESDELLKQFDSKQALPLEESPPEVETSASDNIESNQEAQAILDEIGKLLSNARHQLGFSLEDVEKQTHINPRHLQAMESGNFDALPSPVQGRGMLGLYASFLGFNSETILLNYADALKARLAAQQVKKSSRNHLIMQPPGKLHSLSWLWSTEFILLATLSIGLVIFFIWGLSSVLRTRASVPPTSTALSVAEILLEPITATLMTPTIILPTPTETAAIGTVNNLTPIISEASITTTLATVDTTLVHVTITIKQRAWMKVLVDGKKQFDGRVIAGSAYEFSGTKQVEVQTGNAAALQILYNQQDLGLLGNVGEVITRIYTLQGVAAPTPTVTLTPTATLRPTLTPRPTLTQRPTSTPQPSRTIRPTLTPSG